MVKIGNYPLDFFLFVFSIGFLRIEICEVYGERATVRGSTLHSAVGIVFCLGPLAETELKNKKVGTV